MRAQLNGETFAPRGPEGRACRLAGGSSDIYLGSTIDVI